MALQFVTSQIKDLAITDDKLAGSISNAKLSNSTISGVALGGTLGALSAAASSGLSMSSYTGAATVNDLTIRVKSGVMQIDGSNDLTIAANGVDATMIDFGTGADQVDTDVVTEGSTNLYYTDARVRANRLDQMTAPSGAVSFNSQKITSLADPTLAQDAATKAYVDGVAQGLDLKESVKVATTAAITLSGTQTIDGIGVLADDRVLVKNQGSGADNGIYICKAGSWTRATDFAAGDDEAGAFCFVEQGTVNGDNGFVCTNDKGSGVVGTDALVFTQFSGAGQIVAGDGLAKSGNTLSVNVDDSSIEIASDALQVKALGISNAMLAGSIADSKLLTISTSNKVSGSAVQLSANTAIEDSSGLRLKAATAGDGLAMSASQVLSIDVSDGVKIQGGKLEAELDGSTLSISSSGIKVADGGIANAQIDANAAISFTKLEALNDGRILVGNASNKAASVAMSGDVAISNSGSTTIQALAVNNAKLADDAVTLSKLGITPAFERFGISGGATSSLNLSNRVAEASFRHGGWIRVFRNGQRLEYKASGASDNSEYAIADNGSTTSVTFGAALENLDVVFIEYCF